MTRVLRVNVGCGPSPTPGWANVDNSLSVALARLPRGCTALLERLGVLRAEQGRVVRVARETGIRRGTADRLPFADGAVDVVYSSHMLEHLSRTEARSFLAECRRVLRPGGTLRLVVPDLERFVRSYVESGDADRLLDGLHMALPETRRAVLTRALVGFRGHRWMYDSRSLCELVEAAGFERVDLLAPGETHLEDPEGLDLREREAESIYLEAHTPSPAPA
jgi:predicted SAM-dependent methyltransferase